jgi:succinate dehydrogenase/fumarate reductase flavoprotein subunit
MSANSCNAKPPESDDWKKLAQLAYADGGDGVSRIAHITSEYNRVRDKLAAAEREAEELRKDRDRLDWTSKRFKHIQVPDGKHYWYNPIGGESFGVGLESADFRAAIDAAMQEPKEETNG